MITLHEVKNQIITDPQWWCVHLMNFVDDFRRYKDVRAVSQPFAPSSDREIDALLASTAESLCDEASLAPPMWLAQIPECERPYFVNATENLKAFCIVESPLRFRLRKIFVLENFLSRV